MGYSFSNFLNHSRWGLIPSDSIKLDDTHSHSEVFVLPFLLYSVWQVAYLFHTEVLIFQMLENDQEIVTSLRYVSLWPSFIFADTF